MEAGNVVAMFLEETRFSSREEWERACAGVWDDALAELRTNPASGGSPRSGPTTIRRAAASWACGTRWNTGSATRRGRRAPCARSSIRSSRAAQPPRLHVTNATME